MTPITTCACCDADATTHNVEGEPVCDACDQEHRDAWTETHAG